MKNKIIEKIKKILDLAEPKSNNFESEIETALIMAKKLMAKHNITMQDVNDHISNSPENFTEQVVCSGKLDDWEQTLLAVIGKLVDVHGVLYDISETLKRVVYVGRPDKVEIAVSLYPVLRQVIIRRAEEKKGRGDVSLENMTFFTNILNKFDFGSYALGFTSKLHKRAEEKVKMDSAAEQSKYELVVVNESAALNNYLQKYYAPKAAPVINPVIDPESYRMGLSDAEKESLSINRVLK